MFLIDGLLQTLWPEEGCSASSYISRYTYNSNPAITIASIDCACHCEHPEGAWQSLQKRRDCGACSESAEGGEESRYSLLRLRLATSLSMTILIAGFGYNIDRRSYEN